MDRVIKHLPQLPAERALKVISGRWKAVILHQLFISPRRLSELQRMLPQAAQKVLIQQLRELEAHGLVQRTLHAEVPARVDYAVTPLGMTLQPILQALCEWGRRHAAAQDEQHRLTQCDRPYAEAANQLPAESRDVMNA